MIEPTYTFSRRLRLALAGALLSFGVTALAAPATVTTQVPGYYRQGLGDFSVTAIYDGYLDMDTRVLKGIKADKLQDLLARMFLERRQGAQTAVNAYLVHTGEKLVLVDAGSAQCFGPTMGNALDNIRASGYAPEAIDAVLITHLHPDHACGLLDKEGKIAFPNATVWAAKEDADFWLDEATANAAPEDKRPFFKMVRDAVAPYLSAGNFRRFKAGDPLMSGVSAVPAHGHTPGHTAYLFNSKARQLLVWGDIVHNHAVQFARPEVSVEFDSDQKRAVAARLALYRQASKNGWMIGGAHLPFPGLGHVRKESSGYAWVPVEYSPLRPDR